MRVGGNSEEKAIQILTEYSSELRVPVEAYGKDTTAVYCAERLKKYINEINPEEIQNTKSKIKKIPHNSSYSFETVTGGTVSFDYDLCDKCESKVCIHECTQNILALKNNRPILAISEEEAKKGKCTECLACEVECRFKG